MEASHLLMVKQIQKVYMVKLIKLADFGKQVKQIKVWKDKSYSSKQTKSN